MAKSQQVQDYLEKHKIGNLFEDLMQKVVGDMPDDPVVYMIQTLERKATRIGSKSLLRKSMGDLRGIAVAKDRTYMKPWQTNTKRQTKKKLLETDPGARRPKTTETNLDDFWAGGGSPEKSGKTAASPMKARHAIAWADDDDEELLYRSQGGFAGPKRPHTTDNNPLSGEFGLAREKQAQTKEPVKVTCSGRMRGPTVDAQKHRNELALLISTSQKQVDSGYEDNKDFELDDAHELLEDADDLRSEGVKITKGSGVKVKPMRGYQNIPVEPPVRISICARCAKVMEGGTPSEPAEGLNYGKLLDFDDDTEREFSPESMPQSSARYTEDEFESVSEVSGPRQPVWHTTDSDNEAVEARKGRHMFASSGVPFKGRPMFSAEPSKDSKSRMRATAEGYKSLDTGVSSRSLKGHGDFNRTWTEGIGLTDDEAKAQQTIPEDVAEYKNEDDEEPVGKGVTFRESDSPITGRDTASKHQSGDEDEGSPSIDLQGMGWEAPITDYDSDFTVPPARVGRGRGKARQYQGQY